MHLLSASPSILINIFLIYNIHPAEGLRWTPIAYSSNQPVLDLLTKAPAGLLVALETAAVAPPGAASGGGEEDESEGADADVALLSAFDAVHASGAASRALYSSSSSSSSFSSSSTSSTRAAAASFTVQHYAGAVTYSISNLTHSNTSTATSLPEDLLSLMLCSTNAFVQNAIVSVGMGELPGEGAATEGQLGYIAETSTDRVMSTVGVVDSAAVQAALANPRRKLHRAVGPDHQPFRQRPVLLLPLLARTALLRTAAAVVVVEVRRRPFPIQYPSSFGTSWRC